MVEWFFLDRIDTKSGRAAIGRENHRVACARTHKAQPSLALMQFAKAGTDVALDTTIREPVPMPGREM